MVEHYPHRAGSKGTGATGKAGAEHADRTLGRRQAEALEVLKTLGEASADQVAAKLGRHWFHVRPRFSELKALGEVQDTGRSVATGLGGRTTVYRLSTAEERTVAAAQRAIEMSSDGRANFGAGTFGGGAYGRGGAK